MKKFASFSLIEMLIVIAILGMLASIVTANYRTGQRKWELIGETEKLLSVFKQAQMYAYGGRLNNSVRPTAYGVYVTTTNSYFLYADTAGSNYQYTSDDTIITTFTTASYITLSPTSTTNDIAYSLPLGKVYRNGTLLGSVTTTFTIVNTQENRTSTIIINGASGQIDAQ